MMGLKQTNNTEKPEDTGRKSVIERLAELERAFQLFQIAVAERIKQIDNEAELKQLSGAIKLINKEIGL